MMAIYNERAKATEEIIDSIRDLYSLKLKLPLGNPNLKLIHTNQFLFTELQTDVFELINMEPISNALNSTYSRYSGYELNRWYIEGVTITNDKSNFDMELDLNPFASSFTKYSSDLRSIQKAYTDAFTQKTTNKTSTASTNKKKTVKSTTTPIKLYDVSGFNKSDQEYIKRIVNNILKNNNYPKNPVTMCYLLHEDYVNNHVWVEYNDMQKMCSKGFEGCCKSYEHNCGDGAATLKGMFECIGIHTDIFLGHSHYWCRLDINGTYYYCDQSGGTGQHNWRRLGKAGNNDNVFGGTGDGSLYNDYCW